MADIKRTTEGLEHCLARYVDGLCDDCPYMGEVDRSYMIPMKCKEIIMRDAIELLKEQQPKKGHWIEQEGFDGDSYYDCSVCGESWVMIDGTPKDNGMIYCPHCGAKMDEPKDGEHG